MATKVRSHVLEARRREPRDLPSVNPSLRDGLPAARSAPRGFTLTELLVVIGIMGMLMALVVPAVQGAVKAARNGAVKAELDLLHMALMNYKNEFGSFPPADMTGLWVSGSVNARHPAYRHLQRVFPRLAEWKQDTTISGVVRESPYKYMAQMSPAQAMVFWLRGFYPNPEFPVSNNGAAGSRKKLFDFDEARLYAASIYVTGSNQAFKSRSAVTANDGFDGNNPVYFTSHPSAGAPYVYFDSRCYDKSPDAVYTVQSRNGVISRACPYFTSTPPATPLWAQQHMNSETFQLIAPGGDGSYGSVSASFPNQVAITSGTIITGTAWSAADLANAAGHADNITNFASKPLLDAIESLKAAK